MVFKIKNIDIISNIKRYMVLKKMSFLGTWRRLDHVPNVAFHFLDKFEASKKNQKSQNSTPTAGLPYVRG